jgi:hypothetical protein
MPWRAIMISTSIFRIFWSTTNSLDSRLEQHDAGEALMDISVVSEEGSFI